jgi:hypothetical protein
LNGEEVPNDHIWNEGCYSCDHSRASIFGTEEHNLPCDGEVFLLNVENPATGTIYYKEF